MIVKKKLFLLICMSLYAVYGFNVVASEYEGSEKNIKQKINEYLKNSNLSKIIMDYVKPEYYYLYSNIKDMSPKIIKYLEDGKIDLSFGVKGSVNYPYTKIYDIAIQPDGKVLAIGLNSKYPEYSTVIASFMPNGKIDNSFGNSGHLISRGANNQKIALQSNNKILAAIGSNIFRYDSLGVLDKSFAQGKGELSIPNFRMWDLQALNDGKFIVLGNNLLNDTTPVYMYLENGTIDKTFGKEGAIPSLPGMNHHRHAVKLQKDNKLVVFENSKFSRYLENGGLDSKFINSKADFTPIYPVRLNILDNGKILAAGITNNEDYSITFLKIMQLMPNGLLDTSFGDAGIALIGINGAVYPDFFIKSDSLGNIVIGGSLSIGWEQIGNLLIRLKPDGSIDENFNNIGLA